MDRKPRFAVVGVGIWGQNHALVYADSPRVELAYICDMNEARANEIAGKYGAKVLTDYRDLAALEDVDAVSICTPDFAHAAPALAMLEAGKHVLIEKPMTTDVGEAVRIVEAARRSGKKAMVDFAQRWNPLNLTVKEAIDSGELGTPYMAYSRVSDAISVATKWFTWSAQSGPQWFLFPHTMDLVRWLFAQEPVSVYAVGVKKILAAQGIDTYDAIQAVVTYNGGAIATFETNWVVPDGWPSVVDARYTLYGSQAKVEVALDRSGVELSGPTRHNFPWVPVGRKNIHGKLDSYIYEGIRSFIDYVCDDQTPYATVEDGLINTVTIATALRSMEEGRPLPIELPVLAGTR